MIVRTGLETRPDFVFEVAEQPCEKYFSTAVENIKKKSIFARLKKLDYYP